MMPSKLFSQFNEQILPYQPPKWLKGGHAQTIWAKYTFRPSIQYHRTLHTDSTHSTQVALDWTAPTQAHQPIVVLFHGLEGSSRSHYAEALMYAVQQHGWLGCVAHFRGCGGIPNTATVAYHAGDGAEINHYLSIIREKYPNRVLYAVGVSLGGNALGCYLAQTSDAPLCRAAAIVSTPLDLSISAKSLQMGLSGKIYTPYFLKTLLQKVKTETQHHHRIQLASIMNSKHLNDFDELFTAPIHGFTSAEDYYQQCSLKPLLKTIQTPTLLVNAKNDPFFPANQLPNINEVADAVYLLQPQQGGHAGFVSGARLGHIHWLPETILTFFESFHHE